jgi:hypothetical protein
VSSEVEAARRVTAELASVLPRSAAFAQLPPDAQGRMWRDLNRLHYALEPSDRPAPTAIALADPRNLRLPPDRGPAPGTPAAGPPPAPPPTPPPPGTAELGRRAGALLDEIDFGSFVTGLMSATFSGVLDATIRQLEEFGDLVSSVAKTVDEFTAGNVTPNQARDELARRYPSDLRLEVPAGREGSPVLKVRPGPDSADGFGGARRPAWLADFGLADQDLTDELVETQLVPAERNRIGESRLQLLATMVLLGMNRVTVSGGRISARLMFRAAARERTALDFAASSDPGGDSWGTRGNQTYSAHRTLVSTIGVNAQSEIALQAELYGTVELNFVNETLPLERFADLVQQSILQRNARWTPPAQAVPAAQPTQRVPRPPPADVLAPPAVPPPVPPSVPSTPAPGGAPA